ncbi:Calcium-binding protein 39-like [Porphyridium purpureum]|uniref:Calcium-binding protein 39-like n=1 Tax=Porphyridium purpureum TaxID=35688 RepID=A0A5J4YNM2_PORPP|nr:Calcium-binding protein 39-like [Porphyridium purpureum]|eukprot:POR2081..scf222_8
MDQASSRPSVRAKYTDCRIFCNPLSRRGKLCVNISYCITAQHTSGRAATSIPARTDLTTYRLALSRIGGSRRRRHRLTQCGNRGVRFDLRARETLPSRVCVHRRVHASQLETNQGNMWSRVYSSVFGSSHGQMTASDYVQAMRDAINQAEDESLAEQEQKKAREKVAECVDMLRAMLFSPEIMLRSSASMGKGAGKDADQADSAHSRSTSTKSIDAEKGPPRYGGSPPHGDSAEAIKHRQQVDDLVHMAAEDDLLLLVGGHLDAMAFETRKHAVQVFNNLIRQEVEPGVSVLDVVSTKDIGLELVCTLARGYDYHEAALNCGAMLREMLRSEAAAKLILNDPLMWRLFEWVQVSDFDVASDAQTTFKDLLTRHTSSVAEFIELEYDRFFEKFNALLRSQNYVARRVSLKLLGEMLLERANFNVMTRYIASADNLKLIMNLLLDNRKNIQYEAFHVFKIFVANPNKTPQVRSILVKNKQRMVDYLNVFLTDRDDEQFHEDRMMIIADIEELE